MRATRWLGSAFSLSLLILCSGSGWTQTTTLLPLTDDAWIKGSEPDRNTGDETRITVGKWGPKDGLVRFDAASIAGQTVTQATLELYLSKVGSPGTMIVGAITSAWNEGTVTWNIRPPVEAQTFASVELSDDAVGSFVAIDVTGTVRRWADGSLADGGFLLQSSAATVLQFHTKETSGGNPARLTVITEHSPPPPTGGEPPTILDLSPSALPVVIDESGHYVLDRNWLALDPIPGSAFIHVVANDVTLDLQGFAIESRASVLVTATGDNLRIRNGRVSNLSGGGFRAIDTAGSGTIIERMTVAPALEVGPRALVRDSFVGPEAIEVGAWSTVSNNHVVCDGSGFKDFCIGGSPATGISVVHNHVEMRDRAALGISVNADSTVAHNVIVLRFSQGGTGIFSNLRNTIAYNVMRVLPGSRGGTGIAVAADGNVVEGNLVRANEADRLDVGVAFGFSAVANFYGGNRVAATLPFSLRPGNEQIDWGGNVGF